jgi:5-formyltetrahydrofolate cyclo-ligase
VAIPEPIRTKAELRTAMRRLLRAHPADSRAVCEAVFRWFTTRPKLRTVAVFSAMPEEVDLTDLVARHPDHAWVYPRIDGDSLTFHAVRNPADELAPGAFDIREPVSALPEVPIKAIDAFLCPGLAFDPRGGRLGRGRGFYDRMLASARPDAEKIGVCFSQQIVPDTFAEPHDIHMDAVLHENIER